MEVISTYTRQQAIADHVLIDIKAPLFNGTDHTLQKLLGHNHSICVTDTLKTDAIAARMAFKRSYESEVIKAIHEGKKPVWGVSQYFSKSGLEVAIKRAVERGWMTPDQAHKWNPETSLT